MLHASVQTMILSDAERLRRKELEAYHAGCKALDRETRKLKTYEEEELPGFLVWVQGEFAEELAQVNEWTAMARALGQLIDDTERYAAWKGVSRRIALDVVECARLDGTYDELWQDEEEEEEDEEEAEAEPADDDRSWGEWSSRSEESSSRSEESSSRSEESSPRRRGASAVDKPVDDYLKSLYRKLVRQLHPDVNAALSREKERLWHEVQDAYLWRDVHRLERLYAKIVDDGKDLMDVKASPIGDLRALRLAVEANLKRVRKRIRESQRHVAWGFRKTRASQAKLTRLRRDIGKDIAHDLAMLRMQREDLEAQIERWRHPTTAQSRAKARRAGARGR